MMFDDPSYLIQFGYNAQTLVKRAMKKDHADGVILSPTDYPLEKNKQLAGKIKQNDWTVLCDPQYYIPRTERDAADSYSYFDSSGGEQFETMIIRRDDDREELCRQILEVQNDLQVDAYIAPARFIDALAERKIKDWKELTSTFIEIAETEGRDIPVFASLPVDGRVISTPEERNDLLDHVTSLDPDGFYVSVEYDMDNRYPLTGVQDVHAYLDLHVQLRSNHFEIIAGHTHHISHLLYGLGINATASGHYKNTKAFDTNRWIPDDGFGRQVVYYYSDPLLNDLRIEQGLQSIYASPVLDIDDVRNYSPYEDRLFRTSPDSADWKMSDASWDHYIWSCYDISRKYHGLDLNERIETARTHLSDAKELHEDVNDAVGPIDNIEADIFDEWPTAFDSIASSLDKRTLERII